MLTSVIESREKTATERQPERGEPTTPESAQDGLSGASRGLAMKTMRAR